jgi:Leucine-rich repeat (LRR) protein
MLRLFFLWLICLQAGNGSVPFTEISLLYHLYNMTEGERWVWRPNRGPQWNFTVAGVNPCCTENEYWQGITCSSIPTKCAQVLCSITRIDLERYGLRNQISLNWKDLNSLTHLDLSDNLLTGGFPNSLPSSLEFLDFSDNQLSNSLPLSFGDLIHLVYLDLESNLLSQSLPSTISSLSQLTKFSLYTNRFTGAVPLGIGHMSSLRHLDFEDNFFSGKIPSSFGDLKSLSYFDLSVNYFSHSIPSQVGLMTAVEFFSVEINALTGSIPSSIGSLTAMTSLILEENFFFGSIPSEIGHLSRMITLSLAVNSFTGALPSTLGSLSSLSWLEMNQNFLTGPIAPIAQLSRLGVFGAFVNLFTSSVPCEFSSLTTLSYLDLSTNALDSLCEGLTLSPMFERLGLFNNLLHGPITESFVSNFSRLEFFDFDSNFLSGTIPQNIDAMTRLGQFSLGNNRFTGTIPPSVAQMTRLVQLYLPNNHLVGSLEHLFVGSPMAILNLDLSSNMFEGKIPKELFAFRQLETIALTSNCFDGTLPAAVCEATHAQVISMDGLGAASGCSAKINFIFNNLMSGTIPSCLWDLQNITLLSLSGNGFIGTLPSSLPPSLKNLTLSHNHLSGTLSSKFQSHLFVHLDLSYNKIRGEYSHSLLGDLPQRIVLEVNRLSGRLSKVSYNQSQSLFLNIVNGNIFSCKSLPPEDVHSKSYSCGSLVLDEALLAACVVLVSSLIILLLATSRRALSQLFLAPHGSLAESISQLKSYLTALDQIHLRAISQELSELSSSMSFLRYLEKTTLVIVCLCLLLPLPVYGLRWTNGSETSTHRHLYRWAGTAAYLTGQLPAGLLLASWMVAITVFIYLLRRMKKRTREADLTRTRFVSMSLPNASLAWRAKVKQTALICLILVIDFIAIGSLNALYILSTTQDNSSALDFWIKVSVAIFKLLWNAFYLPLLDYSNHSQRLNIIVRVLNSILIPCIATALSSPACFQVSPPPPPSPPATATFSRLSLTSRRACW